MGLRNPGFEYPALGELGFGGPGDSGFENSGFGKPVFSIPEFWYPGSGVSFFGIYVSTIHAIFAFAKVRVTGAAFGHLGFLYLGFGNLRFRVCGLTGWSVWATTFRLFR